MRCVAGAGLVVLVGCNQVFGIHKTELHDAAPDVIADMSYVKLTWQIASVLPSGAPDPMIVDAPIEPAPKVRYAALGQPWTDASYSPIDGAIEVDRAFFFPAGADGGMPVPGSLPTWRLEYTLAGGVPHEVQWAPDDKHGQLAVPLFGRADRKPVPTGGGYMFTPEGAPANFNSPRMFTTGQWSEGQIPSYLGTGGTIDYDFFNATPMSGSRARPEPTLGDRAFLVDYASSDGCRSASGSAALDSAAIEPGKHSLPAAIWNASTREVTSEPVSLETLTRFRGALGQLHEGTVSGTISLGIAASAQLPPLTGVPPSPLLPIATALPAPVMLTVLQCPYDLAKLPKAAQPAELDGFSRLLHVQLVSSRRVLGVALDSGMETAIASSSSINFKLTFPAAVPTMITLATPANPRIALDGDDEPIDIGPAPGTLTLDFVPELGQAPPDYYDVTLHQLDADARITRRVYTVTAPHVELDGTQLTPGAVYVLEIRSFKGHPDAASGDFRPVSFPYGSAIVFTRAFRAS
jgi:hypothetical protein